METYTLTLNRWLVYNYLDLLSSKATKKYKSNGK